MATSKVISMAKFVTNSFDSFSRLQFHTAKTVKFSCLKLHCLEVEIAVSKVISMAKNRKKFVRHKHFCYEKPEIWTKLQSEITASLFQQEFETAWPFCDL